MSIKLQEGLRTANKRIAALERTVDSLQLALEELREYMDATFARKRGPRPAQDETHGETSQTVI
jgi:hypothetical protein